VKTFERQDSASSQSISTIEGSEDSVGSPAKVSLRDQKRARWWRRLGLLLMAALLILGALNFFGGRTSKATSSGGGYQLEVSYPKTGRPGIGAPMQIQIQKQGGFDGPVTVSMSSNYLDILNVRNIVPDAQQSTSSDKAVTWQFNQPPGDTLAITISAEFDTDEHPGRHKGAVTVIDNGNPAVSTHFTTWEAP
jgi:hypothetical protein